jgi:predicted ATP-grasp superfamily ATP-dependent carboligase
MRFNFPNHVLEMCIRQFMEGKKSSFELKENKKKATLQYNNQYNVNPLRPLTS